MKKAFIALFLIFFAASSGCASDVDAKDPNDLVWHTKLEDAVKIAQKEDKNILVNFTGSDWCVWCKRLSKEVFTQKSFANYANEELVLVKLDFPRSIQQTMETKKYNEMQAYKYGIRGFPTIVLLNEEGNLVGKTGYQAGGPDNYVKHLEAYFTRN
ncbi:MAG: thioredoxin family protein [Melioribacteraceae bacterium]|nr:thioredoxin family protein [Melioribacteraceae bacterium]